MKIPTENVLRLSQEKKKKFVRYNLHCETPLVFLTRKNRKQAFCDEPGDNVIFLGKSKVSFAS